MQLYIQLHEFNKILECICHLLFNLIRPVYRLLSWFGSRNRLGANNFAFKHAFEFYDGDLFGYLLLFGIFNLHFGMSSMINKHSDSFFSCSAFLCKFPLHNDYIGFFYRLRHLDCLRLVTILKRSWSWSWSFIKS